MDLNQYKFDVLNDEEFEEFSRDILSSHYKKTFRTYKRGRDQGIDASICDEKESIIVQVKHYCNSTFSNLLSTMKDEIVKIEKLNVDKYILVTSLNLSVGQCKSLIDCMSGYLSSSDDIFDLKKLNSILQGKDNEWIENKYYKLWLSSTNVLNRIINNAQKNNIEFFIERLKRNISFYVVTNYYYTALRILEHNKLLLIHGEPGIGKTTLAELLVWKFLGQEYRLKFVSGSNLRDLEPILSVSNDEKEIIFLDDFLGSTFLDLFHETSENKLVFFLNKYIREKNKYVVLTTKTSIYNNALKNFEKLNQFSQNIEKLCLELSNYKLLEKAKIFYNHIFTKQLRKEYFYQLRINKSYLKVIKHKNYNPRIIDFITDDRIISNEIKDNNYLEFIFNKLGNPSDIWKYEFEKRLNDVERFLIFTLFSFNNEIEEKYLELSFESRYEYEIKNNGFQRQNNAFRYSLEILSKSFLRIVLKDIEKQVRVVDFINPSLKDFLTNYLYENHIELKRIIASIKYYEQLSIFGIKNNSYISKEPEVIRFDTELHISLKEKLINGYKEIETIFGDKYIKLFDIISVYYKNDTDMLELEFKIVKDFIENRYYVNNCAKAQVLLNILESGNDFSKSYQYLREINFINNLEFIDKISDVDQVIQLFNAIDLMKIDVDD